MNYHRIRENDFDNKSQDLNKEFILNKKLCQRNAEVRTPEVGIKHVLQIFGNSSKTNEALLIILSSLEIESHDYSTTYYVSSLDYEQFKKFYP